MKNLNMLCIGLCLQGIVYGKTDFLGKTPEQVLTISEEKWMEMYTKKYGDSTSAMGGAVAAYTEAMEKINSQKIKSISITDRNYIQTIFKALKTYDRDTVGFGRSLSGGGTMWSLTSQEVALSEQKFLRDVISAYQKKEKSNKTLFEFKLACEALQNQITNFNKKLIEAKNSDFLTTEDKKQAEEGFKGLKNSLTNLQKALKMSNLIVLERVQVHLKETNKVVL